MGITTSVGLGPSKLLAKMAAEMHKPDGLTVLDYADVPGKMWPLPVRELFGIGPRMEAHLAKLGIHTIGDLARVTRVEAPCYPESRCRAFFYCVCSMLPLWFRFLDDHYLWLAHDFPWCRS
ncbi:DNA polymerase IV [Moorella thermoacetica]|nr:DNA polymerase IV [Moorella thermoacetica]